MRGIHLKNIPNPSPHLRVLLITLILLFLTPHMGLAQANQNQPTMQEEILYIFDLEQYLSLKPENKVWQYDVINLVSTLQGLVNRDKPQLYILYVQEGLSRHNLNVDRYWLEKLRSPGRYLADYRLVHISTLENLLELFRDYFTAVVLWDPNVPATGNVALTIAGADGYLPVRRDTSPDSLYTQIVAGGPQLPPRENFTNRFDAVGKVPNTNLDTTRTKKGDAYLWAKTLYLENGMCAPNHFAYFLDPYDWDPRVDGYQYRDLQECLIVNHDFYVSKKSFFMDLGPWWDEVPTDIEGGPIFRGIDRVVLFDILQSAQQNTVGGEPILKFGGFVPWWIKYSKAAGGIHSVSDTAERYTAIISAYNGIIDADSSPFGALANASVFQHFPLDQRYYQNSVPSSRPLENKNYLLFVIGSYDSSPFLYQTVPHQWEDTARGGLPLTWAISPILYERVPHIFHHLYKTKTQNDYFVSGVSGAGYCYPNRFLYPREHSDLPSAIDAWKEISENLYRQFDINITIGADLDRNDLPPVYFDPELQRHFKSFSPHGVSTLKPFRENLLDNLVPFIEETAMFLEDNPSLHNVIQTIYDHTQTNGPAFHIYRFKLATPTLIRTAYEWIQREHPNLYEAVDPYTFFYLLRQHYAGNDPSVNYYLPNFISDTIPIEMNQNQRYECEVLLRNDGWDTWNVPNIPADRRYALEYNWMYQGEEVIQEGVNKAYVEETVRPGASTTVYPLILAPNRPGLYDLILTFEQENVEKSPIQHKKQIVIQ